MKMKWTTINKERRKGKEGKTVKEEKANIELGLNKKNKQT